MDYFLKSIEHYSIPDPDAAWEKSGEVVLVHSKLAPDELLFTDKMIQAFNWPGFTSSHLVHTPEQNVNYQLYWSQKQIRLVLIFGIQPAALGFNIQIRPYELAYIEPFFIYTTDAVAQLAGHKENKIRLWNDLKELRFIP